MLLELEKRTNHYYTVPAMNPQFADTAILKALVDKLVSVGVISETDRFHIYSEAAALINEIPGDNVDMVAELIMLADTESELSVDRNN